MTLESVIQLQRDFAFSNQAHSLEFRKTQLLKLKNLLRANEDRLYRAIFEDFKKSSFETYMTELALIYHEIDLALKNLKRWAKPKPVRTGLVNFPARSFIVPEPL